MSTRRSSIICFLAVSSSSSSRRFTTRNCTSRAHAFFLVACLCLWQIMSSGSFDAKKTAAVERVESMVTVPFKRGVSVWMRGPAGSGKSHHADCAQEVLAGMMESSVACVKRIEGAPSNEKAAKLNEALNSGLHVIVCCSDTEVQPAGLVVDLVVSMPGSTQATWVNAFGAKSLYATSSSSAYIAGHVVKAYIDLPESARAVKAVALAPGATK